MKEALCENYVEGVVEKRQFPFLKYILPTDAKVVVIKSEGESVHLLDSQSRLPKGYEYVRVTSSIGQIPDFGIELGALNDRNTSSGIEVTFTSRKIDSHPVENNQRPEPGNPETAQRPESSNFQRGRNRNRNSSSERTERAFEQKTASQRKQIVSNPDSLGLFSALSLDFGDLSELSEDEIKTKVKSSYRKAAFSAHPDHGGDHEAMKKVNRAFEVLLNKESRNAYIAQTGPFTSNRI